jgi:hypothetical protein
MSSPSLPVLTPTAIYKPQAKHPQLDEVRPVITSLTGFALSAGLSPLIQIFKSTTEIDSRLIIVHNQRESIDPARHPNELESPLPMIRSFIVGYPASLFRVGLCRPPCQLRLRPGVQLVHHPSAALLVKPHPLDATVDPRR